MTTLIRFLLGALPLALLVIVAAPATVADAETQCTSAPGFFNPCAELDVSTIDDLRVAADSDSIIS